MTARKAKKRAKKKTKRRAVKKKRVAKKRITRKRVIRKKTAQKRKVAVKKTKESILGVVTHYFPQVRAAAIKLKAPINLWDNVKIKGHTTDFTQVVSSLQIDRKPVNKAKRGQEIGLLVSSRVRRNDLVYKA